MYENDLLKTESTCSVCGPHCGVQLSVTGFMTVPTEVRWILQGPGLFIPLLLMLARDQVSTKKNPRDKSATENTDLKMLCVFSKDINRL